MGEPFLHILGARGYLGGGDTARGVVVMHHLWMLSTSLLYCSPKLFSRSVESEEARSFGVPYIGFFPAVEPPSAAGICNLFVAISSETCSSFASGTLVRLAVSAATLPATPCKLTAKTLHNHPTPQHLVEASYASLEEHAALNRS